MVRFKPIPQNIDEVTADWLTTALSSDYPGTEVDAVTIDNVIHGTNTHLKLVLDYADAGNDADLPEKIWMKAPFEPHNDRYNKWGHHEIAARFYRDLLPSTSFRAPKCYYSDFIVQRPSGVMLLEDLSERDVTFSCVTKETTAEEVEAGLRTLAEIHAYRWNDPRLFESRWIMPRLFNSPIAQRGPDDIAEKLEETERGDVVPESIKDPERIIAAFEKREDYYDGPFCLLHGDAHVRNTYLEPSGAVGLFDWSFFSFGKWAHDVSSYIVGTLSVEDRREHERSLLEHYLDELAANGVEDPPDFEEAWLTYIRWMSYRLVSWIGTSSEFQPEDVIVEFCRRHGHAAEDLGLFETLGV